MGRYAIYTVQTSANLIPERQSPAIAAKACLAAGRLTVEETHHWSWYLGKPKREPDAARDPVPARLFQDLRAGTAAKLAAVSMPAKKLSMFRAAAACRNKDERLTEAEAGIGTHLPGLGNKEGYAKPPAPSADLRRRTLPAGFCLSLRGG